MTTDQPPEDEKARVICVSVTPALQRVLHYHGFRVGEVNRAFEVSIGAAGKATNVARVLHRLGVETDLIGFAGGATGEAYRRRLREEELPFIQVPTGAETRICQTLIDEHRGEVTELVEEAATPTKAEWAALEVALLNRLSGANHLLLTGKLPPGSPDNLYARWAGMARDLGVAVCVDTQGKPLLEVVKAGPAFIKINEEELAATFPPGNDGPRGLQQGVDALLRGGAEWVLITRGPRPALLTGRDAVYRYSIPEIEPVNPIGSGDATLAGITCALGEGQSMPEAVRFGLACGSANALNEMTGVVDPQEVERLVLQTNYERVGN